MTSLIHEVFGPNPTEAQQIAFLFEECRDDPILFNQAVLGRHLWPKQEDVCRAVVDNPTTIVPAGRAVGKSYLLAGLALWWLYTRENSLVITTAPDHRQVVSVLWGEMRRAVRESLVPLGYVHLTQGYGSPQRLSRSNITRWEALGFAASTTEGLSGQHSKELLVIVDEGSGITEPIWTAIDGLNATRLVVAGNPIRYDCRFRELHDLAVGGSMSIATVPISCMDHPHVEMEQSPVGAVCASMLRQMREIHGEGSPWWWSNILGRFPGEESVRFIPTVWLDACANPATLTDEDWLDTAPGATCMGVDVGGGVGADKSVIVIRNRKQLLDVFASDRHGVLDDAQERLEPVVVELARKWQIAADHVVYDRNGMGRNFGSYLAAHGLDGAVGYYGAGKGGRLYVNRRTANAYAIRRRLDPHTEGHVPFYVGGIAAWPLLRAELMELRSPDMVLEEGQVKQELETKESLTARLKRSPDYLDALIMSFSYKD